jgi:DNA-binding NarL/FixJ family response regulator
MRSIVTTTVFICDDDPNYRLTLKTFLRAQDGIELVGEASSGQEAIGIICKINPHVCLIDLTMPKMNGFDLIKSLQESQSKTKVIVITQHSDETWLDRLLNHEIDSCILKTDTGEDIIKSIKVTITGDKYFSPSVAKLFYKKLRGERSPKALASEIPLTPKEQEVAILTSKGFTVKEIAAHLLCSENTVKTHKSHLMKKISARNSAEVTSWVFKQQ